MKLVITFLIMLTASQNCFGQEINKYKVLTIDSTLLPGYIILIVKSQNEKPIKIFSKSQVFANCQEIKVGCKYNLTVREISRDSIAGKQPNFRVPYTLYFEDKLVLDANETAFQSECVVGLCYNCCNKSKKIKK
jgi:hypothetical protein